MLASPLDDTVVEGGERFQMALGSAVNANFADNIAWGNISDDPTTLSIADVSGSEGDGTLSFTVSRGGDTTITSSLSYATQDDSAKAGSDYTATSGTLSFAPGETSKTISVTLLDDTVVEGSERFQMALGSAVNANFADNIAWGNISDDATTLSVADVSGSEGDGTLSFTVSRGGDTTITSSLSYATQDDSAKAGSDYTATSGTLSFAPGETSKTISVTLLDDTVVEGSERFQMVLGSPVGANFADNIAWGNISDDATTLSVADASGYEGDGTLSFTVSRSGDTTITSSFSYATQDDSAKAGSDYTAASGTISFASGETSKTVSVTLIDDTILEGSERFQLALGSAVGATFADNIAWGNLADDVTSLSINDITGYENDGTLNFTVARSGDTTITSSLDYASQNNSALAGSDYTAVNGSLSFAPGDTSKTISVPLLDDSVIEGIENFYMNLSNAAGASFTDNIGIGTVKDDVTGLSIADVTVFEGSGTLVFTVSRSGDTTITSSLTYATSDNSAVAGSDYTATSGSLSFAPGDTSKTISVTLLDDTVIESTERFQMSLGNPVGATFVDNIAWGNLKDDPTNIAINDVTGYEGSGTLNFTVSRSGDTTITTTLNYATSDSWATAGSDYTAASGSLSFAPGDTSKTISVTLIDDTVIESTERFQVSLSSLTGGTFTDNIAFGYLNDDPTTIAINDVTRLESDGTLTFTVTRSGDTTISSSVTYASSDSWATAGSDYTAVSGSLSFAPGDTTKSIVVTLLDDAVTESNERFQMTLGSPSGATFTDNIGWGYINNDDSLLIGDVSINEADGSAIFTVIRTGGSTTVATVDFATSDGSALAASDYLAVSGTLTFGPGETSREIVVPILDDALFEPDESFFVTLGNALGDTIKDGLGVATIRNDDSNPLVLSALDGSNGYAIGSAWDDVGFAPSPRLSGDFDGDGSPDAVAGLPASGGVALVFASTGVARNFDPGALDGENGFWLPGLNEADLAGQAAGFAGDFNGDGFDDLIIGAPGAGDAVGAVYLVFGGEGVALGGSLDLATLDDQARGFELNGALAGEKAGSTVAAIGDIDGDGFDDVFVGTSEADPGGGYIVLGGNYFGSVTHPGGPLSDVLSGSAAADVMIGGQGADLLTGSGGADVLRAGAGDDVLAISDTAFQRLDGGAGFDTLRLEGGDMSLDLQATADSRISGIEKIDLGAAADHTLTLGLADVLEISDSVIGGKTRLLVDGEAADTVVVTDAWTATGTMTLNGNHYDVFSSGDAQLLIDSDIGSQIIALP